MRKDEKNTVPTLSIITATLNAEQHLPSLITSIEGQNCNDFEWIIVDGGSSDGSQSIVESCSVRNKTLISGPDRGIYDALNKGIRQSSSMYYLVAGADDLLAPDAVSIYVNAIKAAPADLITAPVIVGNRICHPSRILNRFRSGPPKVSAHSVGTAIMKDLHETFGYYSLEYPIAADTLFLRKVVRSKKTTIRYLPQLVGQFGINGCSSRNQLHTLTDSLAANVAAGESIAMQWFLFSLRLLKNASRIRKDRALP